SPFASSAVRPASTNSYSRPHPSASRTCRVASMISGPMPSPLMTAILLVMRFSRMVGPDPAPARSGADYRRSRRRLAVAHGRRHAEGGRCAAGLARFRPSAGQELLQSAAAVGGNEVIETAHVHLAEEDLRHAGAPCALHHFLAPRRIQVDADFLELDAPALQEVLRRHAVGA